MATCSLSDIQGATKFYYNVYKVTYAFSAARNDYALFIETDSPQDGCIMSIYGDLLSGMHIQIRENVSPHDNSYLGKKLVGIMESTELSRAQGTCEAIDPPWQQLDSLGRKIDKSKPFYRSEEWVNDVIEALKVWDILKT
jgi:hypothetical protein